MKKYILLLSFFSSISFHSFALGGCAFTYEVDSLNPLSININYIGWQGLQTYNYDFGDSIGTSNLQNPTYTYSAPGNYLIYLNTVDTSGFQCTYNITASVGGNVNCSFSSSASGTFPDTVNFINTSSGMVMNYMWDFGDGSPISTMQNASHVYTVPGNYLACLTTTDMNGILCSVCQNITITAPQNCQANFQVATSGLTAYFVENSLNTNLSAMNYQWSFGDGTSSTSRFPSHNYAVQGNYNACLFITDNLTCVDSICSTVSVDTFSLVGCMAEFLFTETQPYAITLVNTSFGWGPSFNWDFGDGDTSNLQYPTHTYTNTGSYAICLEVSDTTGCLNTFCDSLTVDSLGNIIARGIIGFSVTVVPPSALSTFISQAENSNISLYPNPAKEYLIVNIKDGNNISNYNLYSISGSICSSGYLLNGKNIINTSRLSEGMYFLEVRNGNNMNKCWKIIKE
jgi:PKD repeat protein